MASRAEQVVAAVRESTASHGRGTYRTRNGRRLVLVQPPVLVGQSRTTIVCQVRLYDAESDTEIPIDPVRQITHPPLEHPAGTRDPVAALWATLWMGVDSTPNPADWFPA